MLLLAIVKKHRALPRRWGNSAITNYWKWSVGAVRGLPGNSDVPYALGRVARLEGHWDETIGYFEQTLALDPRNTEVLLQMAWTYGMLRQFPTTLKLYDRALDITPNDPDLLALKASIYQAQGNLQETPRLLSGINEQSPNENAFGIKINQLRLERNYGEAIRLLQARLAQFRFDFCVR
jgi:tetratricopeptide (TPR) repeat protein